jgi:hypothetical protein
VVARIASALGCCGVLAASVPAYAAKTTPVRIALVAPEGCSSVRDFYDSVRVRTERIHLSTRPSEGLELRVVVSRAQSRFQGQLRVVDVSGHSSTRQVSGGTCEEVVRALSLTAALVVDELVEPPSETASPAAGSSSESGSEGAAAGAPASTQIGAQETPPTARRLTTDAAAVASDASDANDDASGVGELADPSRRTRPIMVEAGAQALVGELVSPRVSVGGALFVDVSKPLAPPFSPSLGVALAHVPAEFGQSAGDFSVRWTAVLVSACPFRFQPSETFSIQPCLSASGGWLTARGDTSETPASASRSWWSAGVLGRVSSALGGSTAVRVELGLSVPLLRRRFITTPPEETVGESPAVSALGALGVAHGF